MAAQEPGCVPPHGRLGEFVGAATCMLTAANIVLCISPAQLRANQKENSKRLRFFFKMHNPTKVAKVDQVCVHIQLAMMFTFCVLRCNSARHVGQTSLLGAFATVHAV